MNTARRGRNAPATDKHSGGSDHLKGGPGAPSRGSGVEQTIPPETGPAAAAYVNGMPLARRIVSCTARS